MNPTSNSNSFFGQKVSVPGVNVNNATPSQLLYQNNYQSETFFGTGGDIQFGIFTSSITGQQTMGMQVVGAGGNILFEMDGQTWYWFDTNGNNIMQVGLLPDGTYGWAVATPGNSVAEAF